MKLGKIKLMTLMRKNRQKFAQGLIALVLGATSVGVAAPAKPPVVLMLSTGADRMTSGKPTGLWLEEFTVPYNAFVQAGFQVIVATPQGGPAPVDPRSNPTPEQAKAWSEATERLRQTLPLAKVDPAGLDAIYIPGGHGAMFDLAGDAQTAKLIADLDARGKVIASVCHGPAALVNVKRADGQPFVAGRTISAFTDEEERAAQLDREMPFLLETRLRELGATVATKPKFTSQAVRDRNLITGQNPMSSEAVAELVIQALAQGKRN